MPKHIPKKGIFSSKAFLLRISINPYCLRFFIPVSKAPTPGKIIFSALAIMFISEEMTTSRTPIRLKHVS